MKIRHLVIAITTAILAGSAVASTLIVDGANNSPFPGDCTFACLGRYQQAYDSSLFSGMTTITAIDFRYSFNGETWSAGNQYRLTIGIANGGVNALSSDQTTNFLSSQTFDIESFSGNTVAGGWYGFTGNYTYDSSLGDLLIDIQLISGGVSIISTDYDYQSGGEFSRTYSGFGWGPETNANVDPNYGNVTRFSLDASNVPEPDSIALVGLALAGLGCTRRKTKRG